MRTLRRTVLLALVALAASSLAWAEPTHIAVSASQTVQSKELPEWTQSVAIISDSGSTCYFRLFTDADTPGNATTSSLPLAVGDHPTFGFLTYREAGQGYPRGVRDSQSVGASGRIARYYKSISIICASGQTAVWRIYAQ